MASKISSIPIPALAEHFRVLAYDYPGHGYTTHATADLEIDAYVEHLAGLLDAFGVTEAHLNGESLGGWVAVKFAAAHPERIDLEGLQVGTQRQGRLADPHRRLGDGAEVRRRTAAVAGQQLRRLQAAQARLHLLHRRGQQVQGDVVQRLHPQAVGNSAPDRPTRILPFTTRGATVMV